MKRWFSLVLRFVLAATLSLLAVSALAQSPTDITQIEQAAATQYGVPIQVLQNLIFGESSNNPNIGCNSAVPPACGMAQFIPSTAAQYGVNVNDATSSINGAAHYLSDLQQRTGSWASALTSYSGGCTPANPCNAAYASAFQIAQAADAGTLTPDQLEALQAGTATSTAPDGSTLSSPTLSTPGSSVVSVTASAFDPFDWLWTQYQNTVQQTLDTYTGNVLQLATSWFGILAALSLVGALFAMGWRVSNETELWRRIGRVIFITVLLGGGTVLAGSGYQQYIVAGWQALSGDLAQGLQVQGAANGPASLFFNVQSQFDAMANLAMLNSPSPAHGAFWWNALRVLIATFIVYGALYVGFVVWFLAQVLPQLLFVAGPVFILLYLFYWTQGTFHRFINVLILMALIAFYASLVPVLSLAIVQQAFAGLPQIPDGGVIATNLARVSGVIVVLAFAIVGLPTILMFMVGAAGAPRMDQARNALAATGAAATGAAAAGAGAVARAPWRLAFGRI